MATRPLFSRRLARAFAALATLAAASSATAQTREGWQLVWSDEFDGQGLPNPQWWDWEEGYIRNNEAQYYTRQRVENSRLEDGHLVIEARRADLPGHAYTSASLTTRRSASWTYGRIEVRAKVATGRGVWPAIWTLGDNIGEVGWPACGEIDIMEFVGFDPNTIHGTVHTTAYNHAANTERSGSLDFDDLATAFHIYAVEWEPDEIRFYIDDILYFTFSNDGAGNDATWPFHRPQHLKLNLAIGGSWGGQQGIDNSIFPAQYRVDYVRVYQRPTEPPYAVEISSSGPGQLRLSPQKESYQPGEQITLTADPDVGMRLGKWKNLQPPRSLVVTRVVDRDLAIHADFLNPAALNRNQSFADGLDHWYNWTDASARATYRAENGSARIDIAAAGSQPWHAQFGQGGLALENGQTYRLGFTAWAPSPRSIEAKLNMNAEPFAAYAAETIALSAEPAYYEINYTHNAPTDPNARIEFDLSTATGAIFFDDVVLSRPDQDPLPAYEAWKRDHQIRPIDDQADPDLDRLPNLIEFLLGLNPQQPNAFQQTLAYQLGQDGLALQPVGSLAAAAEAAGIRIATLQSPDLTNWSENASPSPTDPDPFRRLVYRPTPPIAD